MTRRNKKTFPSKKQSRIPFSSVPVIDLTADDDSQQAGQAADPGQTSPVKAGPQRVPKRARASIAPIFKKGKRSIRLLLIRHAHTQGYHIPNTPLSADGVQQAIELGTLLAEHDFQAVIVSPLMRAMQTACIALGQYESELRGRGDEAPPYTPLTAALPASLASLARALGNHAAAKRSENQAVLSEPAVAAAAGGSTAAAVPACDAACASRHVPVVVAPVIREALGTAGDVGQGGKTAAVRLSAALARRARTERDKRSQGCCGGDDRGTVDPGTVQPWVNDDLLLSQLGVLPWGWWLDKAGKPPPSKVAEGGDKGTGMSIEPRSELLARVGLFRKALARLPPHVTSVAVVSHNHFLKAFSGSRKGWFFTQLKEETVEV